MPLGQPENKKDKRLLVLFAFGLLILLSDLISFTAFRHVPEKVTLQEGLSGRQDEGTGASPHENTSGSSQRLAFFLSRPMAINLASTKDLTLLPGVGSATAEKIIRFREQNGGIDDVGDLELIPGIGKKMGRKISSFVTFSLQ